MCARNTSSICRRSLPSARSAICAIALRLPTSQAIVAKCIGQIDSERMSVIKTLEWTDAGVRFIDQTKLPTEETYVTCKSYDEVADAIRTMIVRGAPAIGVAAAMGVALGALQSDAKTLPEFERQFDTICNVVAGTRPTAVNLFWAIRR